MVGEDAWAERDGGDGGVMWVVLVVVVVVAEEEEVCWSAAFIEWIRILDIW